MASYTILGYRRPAIIPLFQGSTIASRIRTKEIKAERKNQTEKKHLNQSKNIRYQERRYKKIDNRVFNLPEFSYFEPNVEHSSGQQKKQYKLVDFNTCTNNLSKRTLTDEMLLNHYKPSQPR